MTTEPTPTARRTITGSCHCKYIKYEVQLPVDFNAFRKCNCTMCQVPGFIPTLIEPENFKLIAPSDVSEVKTYSARNPNCYRYFCDKCGVQVWGKGTMTHDGKSFSFFIFNLSTVDQPQEGFDPSKMKVTYWNGLTDDWDTPPGDSPFPHGII